MDIDLSPARQRQTSAIADWLAVFVRPGQVTELRALQLPDARAVCGFHSGDDLGALARRAVELERRGAAGVYFTPNPLRPDLLGEKGSARVADVIARHWLLVDCDPVRVGPDGGPLADQKVPSTEAERREAWAVLDACRGTLDAGGLTGAVVGDSGNGWHLCYPIDLPNDEPARAFLKVLLQGLQTRCGSDLARVDTACFDACRIWKLYGTKTRKGIATEDRPHRYARLIEGSAPAADVAAANTSALRSVLARFHRLDRLRQPQRPEMTERQRVIARAKAYIAKEPPAVSGQHGHDRAIHVACVLAWGFSLDEPDFFEAVGDWNARCQPPWSERELRHKYTSALAKADHKHPRGHLLDAGVARVSDGRVRAPESITDPELDADATAADLIRVTRQGQWLWEGWIPLGVLTILAAEPGCGKTRLCADLLRRVHLGLPWPDGRPQTAPAGSVCLWVPSDNQHPEIAAFPGDFGFPPEALYLNATRRTPFAGTMLDDPADLQDFEARITRIKPALVFVDTCLNATDRSSHKPEDAKAFFKPLQEIAARTGTAIVCVTHLNAAGKPLGRRIIGQGRVVIQLQQPDPENQPNRRRMSVTKSFSVLPPALGVTMHAGGSDYDDKPPKAEADNGGTKNTTPKIQQAIEWLRERLAAGPERVGTLRSEWETAGISTSRMYSARDSIGIAEFESEGKKWWRLASDEAAID